MHHPQTAPPFLPADTDWTSARRHYVLFMLGLVAMFNYADRQVLSILFEPIKAEFGASDTQMGLLAGPVFALVYATAALPLARLADRGVRRTLIAICLAWWSGMTMLCGLAQSLGQITLARIGVAMGEAGAAPAGQSMIADIFPDGKRGWALGTWSMFQAIGVGAGVFLGGWLNSLLGWRGVLVAIGAPGLIVALIVLLTVREPRRGMSDGTTEPVSAQPLPAPSAWQALLMIWRVPSARMIIIGIGLNNFTGTAIIAWSPSFFIRVHGLGTATTGVIVGIGVAVGIALSTMVAGVLTDRLARRDMRWRLRVSAIASLATIPCAMLFLLAPDRQTSIIAFLLFSLVAGAISTPAWALMMNVVPTTMRASAVFLANLSLNMLGVALGPLIVGALSDRLAPMMGGSSLPFAMATTLTISAVAAWVFNRGNRTLASDLTLRPPTVGAA